MTRPGFITLWRTEIDDPLYGERPFGKWHAKVDLILHAEHQDTLVIRNTQAIRVQRGQVFCTQAELGRRWGWSRKAVRNFLRFLQRHKLITYWTAKDTRTGFTLVTILDYDRYQTGGPQVVRNGGIVGTIGPPTTSPDLAPDYETRTNGQVSSKVPSHAHPMPTGKERTLRHGGKENLLKDRELLKTGPLDLAGGGLQQEDGEAENGAGAWTEWPPVTEEEFQEALRKEAEAEAEQQVHERERAEAEHAARIRRQTKRPAPAE